MHFCGFTINGDKNHHDGISDSILTELSNMEYKIPELPPEPKPDEEAKPNLPAAALELIEENKKIKPEWWCGLAYATDLR